MKVGAEPKKIAILGGLIVVASYLMYTNVIRPNDGMPAEARVASSSESPSEPPAPKPTSPLNPMAELAQSQGPAAQQKARQAVTRRSSARTSQEWEPRIGARRPEDRPDPTTLDPTLRLDVLARLKQVTFSGGDRSLFDFGQPPPPPAPVIQPKPLAAAKPADNGVPKPADTPPPQPVKPAPPPIPLKFYGFVAGSGSQRRAFFIQGEEIYVAGEGEVVQKRYKIVRIGLNSAVVEDTEHQHQQTLPLEQVPG
jgi:hypothetical protein